MFFYPGVALFPYNPCLKLVPILNFKYEFIKFLKIYIKI